jgi:hypothetical protein
VARRHRTAAGVALVLAPLALLGGQLALVAVRGPGTGLVPLARHLEAWRAAQALLMAAAVFTIPAALGLDHLLRRRAPLWADAGTASTVLGAIGAFGAGLVQLVVAELVAAQGAAAQPLVDRLGPLFTTMAQVQDLELVGLVLLGLGLYRYRAAPAMAAGLLLAGQALSWGPAGQRAVAAAVQLAGMGWLGLGLLRWREEDWRDPPEAPAAARHGLFTAVLLTLFVVGVLDNRLARFVVLVIAFLTLVIYRERPPDPKPVS